MEEIEQGFRACHQNALDLVKASDQLLAAELYGPALSLAVLALEELAKLMAIDGLLYARPDDGRAGLFKEATRSHKVKLSILEMFPFLLAKLARSDPRCGVDKRFDVDLAKSIAVLSADGNLVMGALENDNFDKLNEWKQSGFYTGYVDGGFVAPRSAVPPGLAQKVRQLAWRAAITLDFVLSAGNLERYLQHARTIRAKLSDDQHQEMEELAKELALELFFASGGTPNSGADV